MKDMIKSAAGALIVVIGFAVVLYGCYWIAKKVSYEIFYEDFVKQTVREMVDEGSLK